MCHEKSAQHAHKEYIYSNHSEKSDVYSVYMVIWCSHSTDNQGLHILLKSSLPNEVVTWDITMLSELLFLLFVEYHTILLGLHLIQCSAWTDLSNNNKRQNVLSDACLWLLYYLQHNHSSVIIHLCLLCLSQIRNPQRSSAITLASSSCGYSWQLVLSAVTSRWILLTDIKQPSCFSSSIICSLFSLNCWSNLDESALVMSFRYIM